MIYTLTLNPALDYVMNCNLICGNTNRSDYEEIYPGGKGINVSLVLTRLGMKSVALGIEGGFTGKELLSLLDNKIDTDFVHIENYMTRINVKIKGNNETEINAKGISLENADLLLPKLKKIKSGDWLVLSGSCNPPALYKEIISALPENVNIVLDSTSEILKETISFNPFLVKPNYAELCEYFGHEIKDIKKYALLLQKDGAKNVLVSLGDKGAILLWGNELLEIPAISGKVINTVGAGDSMVAGFLYEYIKTNDYLSAFKMAVACGCSTAFSRWLTDKKGADKCYDEIDLLLKGKA